MVLEILEGVKVLDLTRLLPGPYCTWILSRLGADVIKIEAPNDEDYLRFTPLFNLINNNKKSITLNLKKEDGKKIFLELVSKSDIVVEGFRPGVMDKLGLGYDELKKHNNGIILCSISGYGQDGPYKDLPGHDINYISISGLLGINKAFDMPIIPGITIADLSGGLFGALSIISSLYSRERFGRGAYIDVSMTDVVTQFFVIMFEGNVNQTLLTSEIPFYNIYKTKDGKFISVGAIEEKFWRNFCSTIERDDFIDKQYDKSIISEIFKYFFCIFSFFGPFIRTYITIVNILKIFITSFTEFNRKIQYVVIFIEHSSISYQWIIKYLVREIYRSYHIFFFFEEIHPFFQSFF
jgi:crotonobetainyl-CoA:carnitine CoA-transferase CaiB-like acyl-CoA transferase